MPSLNEIRTHFLDFFQQNDHAIVASAPLVPQNDPTLLFVNAGMVPFKNYFTGAETPPWPRAASSQKSVRAGGKHNDLDNVGYTARHHTFFEMLGNFSFGDYFKEQAITLAWNLLTKEFQLPPEKLTVTVYHTDDEAHALWKKIAGLPDERIIRISTNDNFWSMGDTGPCGPCSEIFFDHGDHIPGGPPGSPDEDGDRFVEIWNLVFMQFEQFADGRRESLPKPSIDTGMGLERIAAVLQGVHDNYDVDLFRTIIGASRDLVGGEGAASTGASHRVIADHLRSSSFLIADGVTPSNEGRGYVLRRIMRRAMRHAHLLGASDPLMHRLAPTLIREMGEAYPELRRAEPAIIDTLRQEEERFRRTLGRGMSLLDEATAGLNSGDVLSGETAFKLYDTYGFPLDLTQDAVRAKGLTVDLEEFDAAMTRQRDMAREAWTGSGQAAAATEWFAIRERLGPTDFTGYEDGEITAELLVLVEGGREIDGATQGAKVQALFDRTPFYAESGGQAGDRGEVEWDGGRAKVTDVQKLAGDLHVHDLEILEGTLTPGARVRLGLDAERRAATRANHSATHLLHAALRNVLGPHVTQKGQMVDGERIRFDFSHGQPVTPDEIDRIEAEVNAVVRQNLPATTQLMAPKEAMAAGAMALFGEKYGESVRVLTLGHALGGDGAYSVELCGGTHVARTGDIALFKIVQEQGVAAGVRRIEALTGEAARRWLLDQAGVAKGLADQFKVPVADVPARVEALQLQARKLEKELGDAKRQLAMGGGGGATAAGPEEIGGVQVMARIMDGVGGKDLRPIAEEFKKQLPDGVIVLIGTAEGKAAVTVAVTGSAQAKFNAADLAKAGVLAMGGQGAGGRPDFAQGGAPDGAKAAEGLAAVKAAIGG
ncbi:MAG: alanine--tRNA ligase [Alphaproteobacteria bacterium]|nr:alanine--tRNA ligase [Alphaproteobacteria bacterium]MBU1513237.1 alanine--tRNA ligase [Alphaproteobacteria bacterium]MBU2095345.1 alanine--tRNA ligase [Alphaproteobacteria bacterium]MBU2152260.1 alanine--tRNA ligase [Alphaproteobacteria bacterium]MBU2306693.1 alanine--tRNA ligase [Alphaproteobacteria bacterium]